MLAYKAQTVACPAKLFAGWPLPAGGSSAGVVQMSNSFSAQAASLRLRLPCPPGHYSVIPHPFPCRRAQKLVHVPVCVSRVPGTPSSADLCRSPCSQKLHFLPWCHVLTLPGSAQFSTIQDNGSSAVSSAALVKGPSQRRRQTGATSVRQDKRSWPRSPRLDLTHTKIAPAMRPCRGRAVCRGRRGLAAVLRWCAQPTITTGPFRRRARPATAQLPRRSPSRYKNALIASCCYHFTSPSPPAH